VGSRIGTGSSTSAVYEVPLATGRKPVRAVRDWVPKLAALLR